MSESDESWSYGELKPTFAELCHNHNRKLHAWREANGGDRRYNIIIMVCVGVVGMVLLSKGPPIILSKGPPIIAILFLLVCSVGNILYQFAKVAWYNRTMYRKLFRMHNGDDPLVHTCLSGKDIERIFDNGLEGEFYQFEYEGASLGIRGAAVLENIPVITLPIVSGWRGNTVYFRFADDHNRVMYKLHE